MYFNKRDVSESDKQRVLKCETILQRARDLSGDDYIGHCKGTKLTHIILPR